MIFDIHLRWALLPVILARVLQYDPADQSNEEQVVEQKLMKALVQFVKHSREFQQSEQKKQMNTQSEGGLEGLVGGGGQGVALFTTILLNNLRQSVKSVMVSQMEKNKLRNALLSSRSRAEVLHVIVQIGDQVAQDAGGESTVVAIEWSQIRDAFMSMLDE